MKTKTILSIFALTAMMMVSGWVSAGGWQSPEPIAITEASGGLQLPPQPSPPCEAQALKECSDASPEGSDITCDQKYNTCMTGLTAIEHGETFCQDGKNACVVRTECYYDHVRACIKHEQAMPYNVGVSSNTVEGSPSDIIIVARPVGSRQPAVTSNPLRR